MEAQGRLWQDFSFVVSSGVRERVIASLAGTPKVPKQLSQETGLRIYHVSRALRELRERGLVECLTPATKGRGRLYALTEGGTGLLESLADSRKRFIPATSKGLWGAGFVPRIRASSLKRFTASLRAARGDAAVQDALRAWGLDIDELTEDTWLPVDAYARFLDLMEARFGDGSYSFIRSQYRESVASFPTVKEQLLKVIPLEALAERASIVWAKEWNFGRLDVQAGRREAYFRHYDWMPTPAMCPMYHGVYEGILKARGFPDAKVTKTRCVRNGDECCEYHVTW